MSQWPSSKARKVFAALQRIGWQFKRQSGSHRTLAREGWPDFVFAFHDGEDLGPRMLVRIAKHTGLQPDDL
jgi:predicted RNA binding protein YcfA (HicA-like mRNA interferase family)